MRRTSSVVLLILALGALFWLVARDSRTDRRVLEHQSPGNLSEPTDSERVEGDRRQASVRSSERPVAQGRAPKTEAVPLLLAGTIVAIDEFGAEHRGTNGLLAFDFDASDSRTHREVEVHGGAFITKSVPLHGGEALSVRTCLLENRLALPEPAGASPIPADGRVELRVRWVADLRLHVLARDTGRELEDVFLYEPSLVECGSRADVLHPGLVAKTKERSVGPSPVRFDVSDDAWLGPRVFYARGPGYAWGRIELDPGEGTEHTLLLDQAGELELHVVDENVSTAEILLAASDELPTREFLDLVVPPRRRSELVFEDLPAGSYMAEARSYGRPVGVVEATVVAGQRAKATLTLELPSLNRVPLEGVLVLPEEWECKDFFLDFWLGGLSEGSFRIVRAEMVREEGSRRRFRWTAQAVQPGRYRVELPWCGFRTEIDTGPDGTRAACIDVPAPGFLSVRCVDERNAVEVESEQLSFAPLTPRVLPSAFVGEIRTPQGEVLVFTTPNRYERAARIVTVGPGKNEVLFRLRARVDDPVDPERR